MPLLAPVTKAVSFCESICHSQKISLDGQQPLGCGGCPIESNVRLARRTSLYTPEAVKKLTREALRTCSKDFSRLFSAPTPERLKSLLQFFHSFPFKGGIHYAARNSVTSRAWV